MVMVFAGPLYSQLRASDTLALAAIDLQALHCSDGDPSAPLSVPHWVEHLEQCGYCSLLTHNPAITALPAIAAQGIRGRLLHAPLPERAFAAAPHYRHAARGPPVVHA